MSILVASGVYEGLVREGARKPTRYGRFATSKTVAHICDGNWRLKTHGCERRGATEREALAEWVGREILPHEGDLRGWLRRRLVPAVDVEDIVQECYCRLAQLRSIDDIASPRAYLFTMARNLAHRQRRHARVVRIESISAAETNELASDKPLQDRVAAGRQEVDRVQRALATLSERARRIFVMRRVEGLSQKDIAAALGVTETVVENDASRSLRAILRQLTDEDADMVDRVHAGGDRAGAQ